MLDKLYLQHLASFARSHGNVMQYYNLLFDLNCLLLHKDSTEESGKLHIAVRGAGLITRWTCSWRDQQCSNSSDYENSANDCRYGTIPRVVN